MTDKDKIFMLPHAVVGWVLLFFNTNQESLFTHANPRLLLHKAEINVLKWYDASALKSETLREILLHCVVT